MSSAVAYLSNRASQAEIAEHLSRCDAGFALPLSARVDIGDYAKKIADLAMRFEAWSDGTLVGLIAAYCNDQENRVAYITSVSVLPDWMSRGIAARLLGQCVEHAKSAGMRRIRLEVASANAAAIKLYENGGFVADAAHRSSISMNLNF